MKVCVPVRPIEAGGMHTFHKHFLSFLSSNNIEVTHDLNEAYDVLFLNSWAVSYRAVKKSLLVNKNAIVVHRIDGSAKDYGRASISDLRQARLNRFSDLTIFQSRYSKWVTSEKYRLVTSTGPVIPNPVDLNLFSPRSRERQRKCYRVSVVSHSTSRRKGNQRINFLASQNPLVDFVLVGNFEGVESAPNVHLLGRLGAREVAEVFASCDFHLQLSVNDACPNVVIEAMACGLPVLYVASGGTPEIVGETGAKFSSEDFLDTLENLGQNYEYHSKQSRKRAEIIFDPDIVFGEYMENIKGAQKRASSRLVEYLRSMVVSSSRLIFCPATIDSKARKPFTAGGFEEKQ